MKTNIHFLSYLSQFCLELEIFQTKVVEKIKTHILCSVTFFRKSCRLWDNVGKILQSRTGHKWQYGTCALHAGQLRLRHTLIICNSHCSSAITMVAWTRLNVTLNVHCLPYNSEAAGLSYTMWTVHTPTGPICVYSRHENTWPATRPIAAPRLVQTQVIYRPKQR
jgi:hypothetical protein